MTIWLVGGTSESRTIARRLSARQLPWVATVASDRACRLYTGLPGRIRTGRLTRATIGQFLAGERIRAIVDASHPFAVEISQLAAATGLPYLRFERSPVPARPPAVLLPDLEALLAPEYLENRTVLLLLGVKALPRFRNWHDRTELWARILPESQAQALAAGFPGERLILETPPVSPQKERSLWQKLGVQAVATKASGRAGGFATKLAVARELAVPLLTIARPVVDCPARTQDLAAVVRFCQTYEPSLGPG